MSGMAQWKVTIPSTQTESSTVYHITVSDGISQWATPQRYSACLALHEMLVGRYPRLRFPTFPPKKRWGNTDPKFIEQRRVDLEKYFQILTQDARFYCAPLKKFLDPQKQSSRNKKSTFIDTTAKGSFRLPRFKVQVPPIIAVQGAEIFVGPLISEISDNLQYIDNVKIQFEKASTSDDKLAVIRNADRLSVIFPAVEMERNQIERLLGSSAVKNDLRMFFDVCREKLLLAWSWCQEYRHQAENLAKEEIADIKEIAEFDLLSGPGTETEETEPKEAKSEKIEEEEADEIETPTKGKEMEEDEVIESTSTTTSTPTVENTSTPNTTTTTTSTATTTTSPAPAPVRQPNELGGRLQKYEAQAEKLIMEAVESADSLPKVEKKLKKLKDELAREAAGVQRSMSRNDAEVVIGRMNSISKYLDDNMRLVQRLRSLYSKDEINNLEEKLFALLAEESKVTGDSESATNFYHKIHSLAKEMTLCHQILRKKGPDQQPLLNQLEDLQEQLADFEHNFCTTHTIDQNFGDKAKEMLKQRQLRDAQEKHRNIASNMFEL